MIAGTPLHVNLLAVSLLIVEVSGIPSSKVPTEIRQLPHLRSQGVVASRHSPFVCRRMRELQDDKLPCHESSKGESLGVQCPKEGNSSRPSRFNRAGIRSDARQVVFLGGYEPPVGRLAPC